VVLLCHGMGDTVDHWKAAQALLRDRGVGSMVFNYSGYGRSEGPLRPQHSDDDFVAAYGELRRRVGTELPVFVLGFSLGSGIAAHGVGGLEPAAAGLFLCEAFTSFREATCHVVPRWMTGWVPEIWETAERVRELRLPVCVVHSTGDRLFPVSMAEEIAAANVEWAEMVVIEGLEHNEPVLRAVGSYWEPILERVLRGRAADSESVRL
jgi:pimeloyl-ACP methyl ester carboxylesterase